jgi:uncharacterized membrane protein
MTFAKPGPVSYAAAMLVAMALAPVWLAIHGQQTAVVALFAFFSKICHQRVERNMLLFGFPTAVCVRCLGIYAGAALGSLIRLKDQMAMRAVALALAVNLFDVAIELAGLHGNLPLLRFLIGGILGLTIGIFLASPHSSADLLASAN